ncbi:hypothetical protein HWV62_3076 [Athelia sp. TMB]|nr:hypothetical protein HWV62_3076 [Athelia sp. TMB]
MASRVSKIAKMTLRREPSASGSSIARSVAKPSKRDQRKAMIKEALRLDKLRLNMKKRESAFVYVGNISSTTTEANLRHVFKPCGTIECITIRCSAGAALAGQVNAFSTPRDRQYATVLFTRSRSVSKALQLDGTFLQGHKITVCLSPGDLPDLADLVGFRIRSIKERKGAVQPVHSGFRGLMPAPTERIVYNVNKTQVVAPPMPPVQTKPKSLLRNFMFWNMTFSPTVI